MTRAELIATLRAVADQRGESLLRAAADALEAERKDTIALLRGEARKYAKAVQDERRAWSSGAVERMSAKASELRTMAAYIERGDHEGAAS